MSTARRTFLTASFAVLAAPLAAEAQQAVKLPRIGLLGLSPAANPNREAFLQGLRDLGYVEGRNVVIEYRIAEGKPERYPALAAELVALEVDVIVAGNADDGSAELYGARARPSLRGHRSRIPGPSPRRRSRPRRCMQSKAMKRDGVASSTPGSISR